MASIGNGYGSECHLLRWMGRHRRAFDVAVNAALGLAGTSVDWLDSNFAPLKVWPDAELKGLEFIDDVQVRSDWNTWWPTSGNNQNWDAVGWLGNPSARRPVLVEAKAHIGEIYSACTAKPHGGRPRIEQSLRDTALALGITDISKWLKPHYQLANRLAVLHFLQSRGFAPQLLLIYFVGDQKSSSRNSPQSIGEWAIPLVNQKTEMGLPATHALSPCIRELFLHVSEAKAWLRPDATSLVALNGVLPNVGPVVGGTV